MATILVNGTDVTIGDAERLNLVQAARRAEVEVPHYCWHPALSVVASCRMCLVEVGERKDDGSIVMQPRLAPACQTPAKNGTVVVTNSKKVKDAQAATLEYLLLNHPLDCPTCDQAGECFLQDYSFRYGRAESRLHEPKIVREDKTHIGEHITLFTDRCVMCSRCVRFTREISGTAELCVVDRGAHAEIDTFPGKPCNNKLAGNVVDLCPVGALCSKDFLYKQRVWWLRSTPSVCPLCSTGCSIQVDQNENRIYRLRPRYNPLAQGHFMCDDGRFGFSYVHDADRLQRPLRKRTGPTGVTTQVAVQWKDILPQVRERLEQACATHASGFVAVLSPWMTCEEAYILAAYVKRLASDATLALAPVPLVGDDDHYPKAINGQSASPPRFTIRAEKCPNRKGVAAVLRHFQGDVVEFENAIRGMQDGRFDAAYVVGGYPTPWIDESAAAAMSRLTLLVVQDLLPSPASTHADYVLPGGSFAERDGTFVNFAGLAQQIKWSIRPAHDTRPDHRILHELMGRQGMFHAADVRREMADAIAWFAPLATGDLGEHGVLLEPTNTN